MEKEQKANVVIFCEVLVASQPLIKNIYFFTITVMQWRALRGPAREFEWAPQHYPLKCSFKYKTSGKSCKQPPPPHTQEVRHKASRIDEVVQEADQY